jgi:hypothetical protein
MEAHVDCLRLRALSVVSFALVLGGLSAGPGVQSVQAGTLRARAAHVSSGQILATTTVPGWVLGVSATSANNAWAVGQHITATGGVRTLILHWNGRAWSKVASPSSPKGLSPLQGVSATSATNAWAVGGSLILHWNGRAWSKVASPNPSARINLLDAVSATSATNAWAAGDSITAGGVFRTLILHWDGRGWSKVASPNPRTNISMLLGVSATSATNAWAVGGYCAVGCTGLDQEYDALILHWNGTAWSKVAAPPSPNFMQSPLWGVSAASSTSAWAVGFVSPPTTQVTLILHWNGRAWSRA